MTDLIQNSLDGLMMGSAYALLAVGFSLIFGVLRRLNLSYGASVMVGVYGGVLLHIQWRGGPGAAAIATVVGSVLAGLYVERLCFAPQREAHPIAAMVASFAIWMQLEELVTAVLPGHSYPFPSPFSGEPLRVGPFLVRPEHLLMLALAVLSGFMLHRLLFGTRVGLGLRALIEHPRAASLAGIPAARLMLLAFLIASALGGTAGYLIAVANGQVMPMFGMWATQKGLIAMMLGGLGSLRGAAWGGLLLGLIEAHAQWYLGASYRELAAYLILFLFLVLRPGGVGGVPTPAAG